MSARMFKSLAFAVAGAAAIIAAGCGEYLGDQGRAPVQVVITALEGAPGDSDEYGTTLASDVLTKEDGGGGEADSCFVRGDGGQVTMSLVAKNQTAGSGPTPLNQITITRYRVEYLRSDRPGAVQGVDVPFAFESGVTFTIPTDGTASAGFTLVRNTAKSEAPLMALRRNGLLIQTVARVTFWGRDQSGNEVAVSGDIGITFGDFGDYC